MNSLVKFLEKWNLKITKSREAQRKEAMAVITHPGINTEDTGHPICK